MDRRTKDQCYQRYNYSLREGVKKGVFNETEDFMIIMGVRLYANDWAKICRFIPHRTPIQVHSR